MILLCYDGSDDAQAAVQRIVALFAGKPVTVLAVWEPYLDVLVQNGFGIAYTPPMADVEELDRAFEERARQRAEEGARQLGSVGVVAQPRVERAGANVAATILAVADEVGAEAIVLGTRGRGSIKSLLLGSVSHAVVQHADRPVVVVPSDPLAQARRSWHETAQAGQSRDT